MESRIFYFSKLKKKRVLNLCINGLEWRVSSFCPVLQMPPSQKQQFFPAIHSFQLFPHVYTWMFLYPMQAEKQCAVFLPALVCFWAWLPPLSHTQVWGGNQVIGKLTQNIMLLHMRPACSLSAAHTNLISVRCWLCWGLKPDPSAHFGNWDDHWYNLAT